MKWVTVACACLTLASSYPVQNTPRSDVNGKKVAKRGIPSLSSLFGHTGSTVSLPSSYGHFFTSAASSPSLSSFSPFSGQHHHHHGLHEENHKTTITVTKKVPIPYAVTVEKKVPFKIEVPVDRPYPVYVPKPYPVYIEKKVPYEVKVAVPQPYEVEKKVPVPVEVPYDRPFPVHIEKPYPVIFEKKVHVPVEKPVPVPVKIPIDRPFPIHIPVEKYVPYAIEKPVPYPVKIPVERPVAIPVEEYSTWHHHAADKPHSWDQFSFPSRFHHLQHPSENLHWTSDNFFDKSGHVVNGESDEGDAHLGDDETGLERRRQTTTNDRSDETRDLKRKATVVSSSSSLNDDDVVVEDKDRDRRRYSASRYDARQLEIISGATSKDREKVNATNSRNKQTEKQNAILTN